MSRDFLSQVIRTYGSGLQEFVGRYLDESIQQFAREQRDLRDKFKTSSHRPARDRDGRRAENYQRWKALQEEVFSRCPGRGARKKRRSSGQRSELGITEKKKASTAGPSH